MSIRWPLALIATMAVWVALEVMSASRATAEPGAAPRPILVCTDGTDGHPVCTDGNDRRVFAPQPQGVSASVPPPASQSLQRRTGTKASLARRPQPSRVSSNSSSETTSMGPANIADWPPINSGPTVSKPPSATPSANRALPAPPEGPRTHSQRVLLLRAGLSLLALGFLLVATMPLEASLAISSRVAGAAFRLRKGAASRTLSHRDRPDPAARELAASRMRIVSAQDAERRRIERNIHDGVQQEIVALGAKLRLARNQLRSDPGVAEAILAELQQDACDTVEMLRGLARGIYPNVLTDRGLLSAIESQAAALPIPVVVDAATSLREARYPEEIEAAGYFFVSEALANVLKHASARQATVRLKSDPTRLVIEVRDDGVGFLPAEARGSGLSGLRDRIEAVGGTFEVVSRPGEGTRLGAYLPLGNYAARLEAPPQATGTMAGGR